MDRPAAILQATAQSLCHSPSTRTPIGMSLHGAAMSHRRQPINVDTFLNTRLNSCLNTCLNACSNRYLSTCLHTGLRMSLAHVFFYVCPWVHTPLSHVYRLVYTSLCTCLYTCPYTCLYTCLHRTGSGDPSAAEPIPVDQPHQHQPIPSQGQLMPSQGQSVQARLEAHVQHTYDLVLRELDESYASRTRLAC